MKPAYRTLPKGWLTVAESALLLGISRVSVYKALNVGRLEFRVLQGRRCVEAKDLKTRYWGSSQRVADRPLHGLAELTDEALAAAMPTDAQLEAAIAPINEWIDAQRQEPEWERIADRLNAYLGAWPGPPWTADQANTMALALAMATDG